MGARCPDGGCGPQVQGKTGGKIYGPSAGSDYVDNQLRFSLFCQAAIEAPRVLNLSNNEFFDGPFGEEEMPLTRPSCNTIGIHQYAWYLLLHGGARLTHNISINLRLMS